MTQHRLVARIAPMLRGKGLRARSSSAWGAALVLLCAGLATSSLLTTRGLPNTSDGVLHLFRSLELVSAWQQGVLYPRWAPDFAFGYGYPIFNYVPPLLSYLSGLVSLCGLDMQTAMKLAAAASVAAGGLGVFFLASEFLSPLAAALAGVAYALPPYRLFEIYIEGNYPQLLATAIMPYALWGIYRLVRLGGRWNCALLALSVALLALSHNISAMLFAPLLGAYALWRVLADRPKHWPRLLLAAAAGLLAAAFFWLPAVAEQQYVQTWRLSKGFFDYRLYFLSLSDLVALPQTLDFRCANPFFPMSVGGHLILLSLPALPMLGRRSSARGHVAFMLAALLGYMLMMLPLSGPVWSAVPVLAYAEFPQRFLGVAALPLSLLVGSAVDAWEGKRLTQASWAALALAVIVLGAAPYALPRKPFIDWSSARAQDVQSYERSSGNLGTTSAGEYLPRWVEQPPTAPVVAWPGLRTVEQGAGRARFTLEPGITGQVVLPLFYFPGWRATVDARPVEISVAGPEGLIAVQVPADGSARQHDVELVLQDTPLQLLSWRLSALGLGLLLLVLLLPGRAPAPAEEVRQEQRSMLLAGLALVAAAVLILKVCYIEPDTMLFRQYSPPGTVLAAEHHLNLVLGQEVELLGYDLERNQLPEGESIVLTLYWQALAPLTNDYRSFVHLDSLADGHTLLSSEKANPGGIPTSHWHPALYVEDRYEVPVPSGLPAVGYALRVGLRQAEGGFPLRGSDGAPSLTLQTLYILHHLPVDVHRFPGQEWYRFGDAIRLLGYDLDRSTLAPGESASLVLFWTADVSEPRPMKRFVHLIGPDGRIAAQWDEWPVQGLYPTDRWLTRYIVVDPVKVQIPYAAVPGQYTLLVGLYDAQTLERPPVSLRGKQPLAERAVLLPVRLSVR